MAKKSFKVDASVPAEQKLAEVVKHLRRTNAALARVIRHDPAAPADASGDPPWQGEFRLVASNRKLLRELGGTRRPLSERHYPPLLAIMEGVGTGD